MLIHMHEPHSSGVRIITHFDRVEVVMIPFNQEHDHTLVTKANFTANLHVRANGQ